MYHVSPVAEDGAETKPPCDLLQSFVTLTRQDVTGRAQDQTERHRFDLGFLETPGEIVGFCLV